MINKILTNLNLISQPQLTGLESILQYDGFNGPAGIFFVSNYRKLPCKYSMDYLEPESVHYSLANDYLKSLTPICHDLVKSNTEVFESIILNDAKNEAVYQFSYSSVQGGTYSLKLYYAIESSLEIHKILETKLLSLRKKATKNQAGRFFILSKDAYNGFDCKQAEIDLKNVNLKTMYNENVGEFYSNISTELNENKAGLYILHGPPGTGKTSFINYLIRETRKDFIFIPSNLVDALLLPEFIELLWGYRNSILIIEDAEKALQKRTKAEYSPVSSLLNITDGLLGDVLNLKVICTLNSELNQIDPALLRKGRLKGKCYFDLLNPTKANQLCRDLNKDLSFDEPVALTEIFAQKNVTYGVRTLTSLGF